MSRMLIVDDEQQILDGLKLAMRRQRTEWEVSFATRGDKALELLAAGPFDVVLCDMRMPGMDGSQFLQQVKELYPETIRIILSAYAEQASLMRAVAVAHQFLAKPCGIRELQDCIDRIRKLRAQLANPELRRIVGEMDTVPSLPSVFLELNAEMQNADASASSVAAIIERDAGMSAKLLQLVNSAFFGLGHPISRITEAINYLGFNLVKNLALSVGIFQKFSGVAEGFKPEVLQQHALLTGLLVSKMVSRDEGDLAFMSAVLHDLGQLVVASRIPEKLSKALQLARQKKIPQHLAEREVLGADHAMVAAYVLGIWGLPGPIVEAVAYHHDPPHGLEPKLGVMAALYIANRITHEISDSGTDAEGIETLDMEYVNALGVGDKLAGWRKLAQETQGRT
jgi:HD-like signal output (HDOD) protein